MECGESAGELEGNQKPLGVLSSVAVLAAVDWFRTFVFSYDAAFLKALSLEPQYAQQVIGCERKTATLLSRCVINFKLSLMVLRPRLLRRSTASNVL